MTLRSIRRMNIPTVTTMSERALLRLLTWATPAMPTSGFSYSSGLEAATDDGLVRDERTLREWIATALARGAPWNDAVLVAEAMRGGNVDDLRALARALAGSAERLIETEAQGDAFLDAARAWIASDGPARPCALPVALGWAAAAEGIAPRAMLLAALHGWAANQVQAALRLMPLGQRAAARVMAALEPVIEAVATRAERSTLDDLGTFAIGAEIAAMRHETMRGRMFRT